MRRALLAPRIRLPRPGLMLAALALASPAAARPTDGVALPHADVAAGDHAEAVEENPAGLGFGERFQLAYTWVGSDRDRAGQGHAAFLSLGLLDPYTTGLGVQWLNPPGPQTTLPVKLTWAHALRLDPTFSIGFSWSTFFADDTDATWQAFDDVDTFDVGVQIRPAAWLAAGITVTDLNRPLLGETPIERGYDLALAVRPGTDRVELSGFARIEEGDGSTRFGGRIRLRLFGRFALVGRYETDDGDGAQRLLLGLSDEGLLGGGLFWHAPDLGSEDGRAGLAVTGRLRSRGEALPSLLPRPIVAEVEVGAATEYTVSGLLFPTARAPFLTLLRRLRHLERHPEVAAVLLAFTSDQIGWAQAAELRAAINRLRAAGKKVYAWLPVGDTRTYSVAAAADRIFTTPAGGVLLTGLQGEATYLGLLFERLGVRAQFVATGAYKSAPEMFTRSAPSPAARAQQDALLDDVYARVVGAIAAGRGLDAAAVRRLIDEGPYTAEAAKKAGLVDGVIHYDEFEGLMREAIGHRVAFAGVDELLDHRDPHWGARPEIAVLYAAGTLVDGASTANPFTGALTTGSETLARAAERLRHDRRVAAVVLRIDSPGGSVTASDVMWRALTRLAEEKPLIVSMGDVAASGGYYIAVAGRTILASPETITGSIGVFSGKFDLSGLMSGLGITTEQYLRGERADLLSMSSAWSPEDEAKVRASMDALYGLFLDRVAQGRPHLNRAQVEPLAGGRVWTGAQARACGLVDRPEGLMTAIDLAALAADVGDEDYRLIVLPEPGELGALPTSPLGLLAAWFEARYAAAPLALPAALARVIDLPALQFHAGTPLALLPFVIAD
ncbi:MAG: signal peptide peptidase SppA [bacterium]